MTSVAIAEMSAGRIDPYHGRHFVYRLFDCDGNLLYVGASQSVLGRLNSHRSEKKWWPEVATVTLEEHTSRQAALSAEKAAIVAECPRHNVMSSTINKPIWYGPRKRDPKWVQSKAFMVPVTPAIHASFRELSDIQGTSINDKIREFVAKELFKAARRNQIELDPDVKKMVDKIRKSAESSRRIG